MSDAPHIDTLTVHPLGSPEQRLGSLEQDMAAVKTSLAAANAEIAVARERYHDTTAPHLQRLVIQSDEFVKAIGKIETTLAGMTSSFSSTVEKLDGHIVECAGLSKAADTNRRSFRKEMRGYFVSLIVAAIGLWLSQKFHLSIVSGSG